MQHMHTFIHNWMRYAQLIGATKNNWTDATNITGTLGTQSSVVNSSSSLMSGAMNLTSSRAYFGNTTIIVDNSPSIFGSVDAIFLTSVFEIWLNLVIWTMVGVSFVFGSSGFYAVRINSSKRTSKIWYVIIPTLSLLFGSALAFIHSCLSSALIAAISVSIPYPVGIDIAAGLGLGQAIVITYFHLGRADFIHR